MADDTRQRLTAALAVPYNAPVSEFTTPSDLQRERLSGVFGWDVGRPWQELARRMLTQLPFALRSSVGARVGNQNVWAGRTPSGVTGGRPNYYRHGLSDEWIPGFEPGSGARPASESSLGLIGRHPEAFERYQPQPGLMRSITPEEMGLVGPSAPANAPGAWGRMRYQEALEQQQLGRPVVPPDWRVVPGGKQ